MSPDIDFGYNPPLFAGAPVDEELVHSETPFYEALDWADVEELVLLAEDLGFDSVWAPDHFILGRDRAEFEAWTFLAAVAGMTDLGVGTLVLCNGYRNPALVAKMAATLDVISGGQLTLGIGAGWFEEEYESYGWQFRDDFERLLRLDEAIQVVRAMWEAGSEGASFDGEYYRIDDAYCVPEPVQDPHPPIMVGGGGEGVTLKLVARRADAWNGRGSLASFEHKLDVLREHCETEGRDFDEIELSWDGHVICARDETRREEILARLTMPTGTGSRVEYDPDGPPEEQPIIVGEPEECAAAIEDRIEAGATTFQFWFTDAPDARGMELFADEVLPEFR